MTQKQQFPKGVNVRITDGEKGIVEAYARGWYTIKTEDGEEIKAREADLTEIVADQRTMAKTLQHYRAGYQPSLSTSGKKSLNCGDAIAKTFAGCDLPQVFQRAEALLGLDAGTLKAKYGHLNVGSQRMNAGNLIRNAYKRGDVTLDDITGNALKEKPAKGAA